MKRYICILAALCAIAACTTPKNGEYTIHLLTTNDVHGRYFDSLYVEDAVRPSLINVSAHVDSLRTLWGEENVVLIDAGDCLQGDNASFYFNFIDTVSTHLFARMVDYIGYDAVVVGNHDIETGHPVYDRVEKDMKTPFLAANAISETTGKSYFKDYKGWESIYIENLTRNARSYILMSWAVEGQPGDGHVNGRSNEYVINQMKSRGYTINWPVSRYLRKSASLWWFKNTIMLFERR